MEGMLSMRGSLMAVRSPRAPLAWKVRNAPNMARGLWRLWIAKVLKLPFLHGQLEAVLIKADGTRINYGVVSHRVVTTAFVTALATYMFDGSGVAPTAYDYHDAGIGVETEAVGNTALGTPWGGARTNGTPTNPSAGLYVSAGTIAFNNTFAITEHSLFSADTVGTVLDRSLFSAINVINGDSITFTYTLTITAGG